MFARSFYGARYWAPRYFGDGGDLAPVVIEETPSGGWRRKHAPFRDETETEREARIKAERVRMGIIPPDPDAIDTTHSINSHTAGGSSIEEEVRHLPPFHLAAHLLPEDLAGLEALAARAAQLTIDEEIRAWLLLAEQQRLNAEWLRDEDDAAVLMLAIATIH
jgi:hypothetical protein